MTWIKGWNDGEEIVLPGCTNNSEIDDTTG